jgi:hypothetical protein
VEMSGLTAPCDRGSFPASGRMSVLTSRDQRKLSVSPDVSRYVDCSKLLAFVDEQNELLEQKKLVDRLLSGSSSQS